MDAPIFSLKPYEDKNLIFFDTEFSSLDPEVGEILSIGIVKLSGEELYVELDHAAEPSEWVAKTILPTLKEEKVTHASAVAQIQEFLGDTLPFAVAFVDNYDVIYLTKLFGHGNLPFRWATIDFASILFAHGINPIKFLPGETGAMHLYKKLGINPDDYRKHHALDDARLLRDAWVMLAQAENDVRK